MPTHEIDGVPIWCEELDLLSDGRLAALPGTRHTEVVQRSEALRALVGPFLS